MGLNHGVLGGARSAAVTTQYPHKLAGTLRCGSAQTRNHLFQVGAVDAKRFRWGGSRQGWPTRGPDDVAAATLDIQSSIQSGIQYPDSPSSTNIV